MGDATRFPEADRLAPLGLGADPEARAQVLQQSREESARVRNGYAREANSDSSVDVLA